MPTLAEVLILALWAPIHLQIHEGLHAVTINNMGGKVLEYRPYPHIKDDKFYFGRINYEYTTEISTPEEYRKLESISNMAPYMFDFALYNVSNVSYRVFDSKKVKRLLILIGMVAPLIDTTINLSGTIRGARDTDFSYMGPGERAVISTMLIGAWINAGFKWIDNQ